MDMSGPSYMGTVACSGSAILGIPKSNDFGTSSTKGNAEMATSQLRAEIVEIVSGSSTIELTLGDDPVSSASPFGQMPNCSYRSKKLELVGGAFSDMLVDRDRGNSTAPDPLRCMGADVVGETGVDADRTGRRELGGGSDRTDAKYGGLGRTNGGEAAETSWIGGNLDSLVIIRDRPSIELRLNNRLLGSGMGENSVLVIVALPGTSLMFAKLFAFVSFGLRRNCFKSLKLGELRGSRGRIGEPNGTLLECMSRFEAKGSGGRDSEDMGNESDLPVGGGESGSS